MAVTKWDELITSGDRNTPDIGLRWLHGEGAAMDSDALDVQPQDVEQLHEIDLVSELMIACSQWPEERLPVDLIDAVLDVPSARRPTQPGL